VKRSAVSRLVIAPSFSGSRQGYRTSIARHGFIGLPDRPE
jgi:hypothetical protein